MNRLLLQADLPGVDPDAIEIRMEEGVLTIQGSRNSESTDEQGGYKRYERVQRIEKDRRLTGGVYSRVRLRPHYERRSQATTQNQGNHFYDAA